MGFPRLASAKSVSRAAFVAAGALWSCAAAAQVAANNYNFYPTPSGMWVISPNGRVSYCQSVMNASGAPLSKCSVIGSIGATQAWTAVIEAGPAMMFAVNRQAGTVVSCTIVLMGGTNPSGGCAVTSTLAALQ